MQCTSCKAGLVKIGNTVWPPALYGDDVLGLPQTVSDALMQARLCFGVGAYEATELVCRKILMHVACDLGAEEGKTFGYYIDFIRNQGYITPNMESWVDQIRERGNKAAHHLLAPGSEEAQSTLDLCTQLLKLIYEMPYLARQHASGQP